MISAHALIPRSRHAIGLAAVALTMAGLVGCTQDGTSAGGPLGKNSLSMQPGAMPPGREAGGPPPERFSSPATVVATASTQGVVCAYEHSALNASPSVNAVSEARWSCTDTQRVLSANGLPDHGVGVFPNPGNPNTISAQKVAASFTLSPHLTDRATGMGGPRGAVGFVLNGVKIDAGTNGGCNDAGVCDLGRPVGSWRVEALGQNSFDFGVDSNHAHVQPNGEYHYHGMPEGFIAQQGKGTTMTLMGWAADGFPIYARYGHSVANDAQSATKVMSGSYRVKAKPDANRPAVAVYPMGAFQQDMEYVAGLGDLDECNGRTGVTPEFPQGIYHYFATDTYPYFQRCVKGQVSAAPRRPRPS